MPELKILALRLDTTLSEWELPLFRGAVVNLLPNKDVVYHNHEKNGLRYAYPLIQYRCINSKATILGVGEGVDSISALLSIPSFDVHIGNRYETMKIEKVDADVHQVQMTKEPVSYRLNDWVPLNEKNYTRFMATDSLAERILQLERILTGNILSMLKGVGIFIDFPLHITLSNILHQHTLRYKNMMLQGIDIEFKANISLPDYIGLGKHASVGFGTLTRVIK